jgi:hypothetical protein
MTPSDFFSILSDEDTIRIIKTVYDGKELKIGNFESPKRYYTRLSKLKSASILERGIMGKTYEMTSFGSLVYEIIQRVNLVLHLVIIDTIGDKVPNDECEQIIQSLISESSIRDTLKKAKARASLPSSNNLAFERRYSLT